MFFKFLICDRGMVDLIVWVILTLNYPNFIRDLYGKFLLGLALRENVVYLCAYCQVSAKRSDIPEGFYVRSS